MRKILLATLVLSFAATSAMAAPRNLSRAAAQAYASTINANTVVNSGTVRGTDPDPWVRFELNREVDPANSNG